MTTAPQFQGYLDGNYSNLDVNLEDITISEPPTDDSHTTRMELEELEHIIEEAKLPREIMRVADRDPLRFFYSVAKKKGLDPLEEEAKEWADDWTKLSFEFKLKFKRRRPWEVKKEHDIDFVVNKSDTTESPSYPSGHAMMGYGVAEFYKDKYPLMADEWDNVAEIIAHSRLQMGVHYPSDVEASKKIVEQLVEQGTKLAEWEKEAGRSAAYRRLGTVARQQYRRWAKSNPGKTVQQWQSHTAKAPGSVPTRVSAPTATYRGGTQSTRAPVATPTHTNTVPKSPVTVSSSKKAPGQGVSSISQPVQKASPTAPTTTAPTTTAPTTTAPTTTAPATVIPQTWGERVKGWGSNIGNWAGKNPMQATAVGGATAFTGYKGFDHFRQPSTTKQMPKFGSVKKTAAEKLRLYYEKTSSEQPLLRHRSTLLIRDPLTGKLLAAHNREDRRFNDASPFYFPGGGLYEDEYDTPRNPTEEEILEGARREALEELGISLLNPRVVGGSTNILPIKWRAKTLERRGVPYVGGHEHLVLADRGDIDNSLYNVEGDAFTKGKYYDPQEVYDSLAEYGATDGQFASYNREQARAIKDNLLKKNASDLSVLTAVPKQNLDLIMRKGLYSQKAMLDDPEVLSAFLAQRNADKAWKDDEQYDEKRFKEQYDKRLKLMEGDDAALSGPSVFFTEPDPDKVSDPRHFINKFDTQKLRVNLAKLLRDIPETRIQGAELIPFPANAMSMSDEEWDEIARQRRRDLTSEEVEAYTATDPKELWKDYGEDHIGRYYAANVPHAFIRTPSGIIPPEYLEQVEKTSSAKEQLKHILVKKAALEDEFQPDLTPDDLKALGVYDQVYGDAPSEASMKEWPEHWINPQDPLGWLQWYDRYSGGRRTDDDERQMKRWKSFKARHLAQYLKKPTPRRAAALRNWGIDVGKY